MYKLLLAGRYLRSRYIALASVISVTLGVATLIIVNSVMAGFTKEMHERLNGILSDIVFESHGLDGFPDAERHKREIGRIVGRDLAGMTATVHVPAMLSIKLPGQFLPRQITLIGIDEETYASVSDFSRFLMHPSNRRRLSFRLHEDGYGPDRESFPASGWRYRRARVTYERLQNENRMHDAQVAARRRAAAPAAAGDAAAPPPDPYSGSVHEDPYAGSAHTSIDPMQKQSTGIILGIALCSQRHRDAEGNVRDYYFCRPGDDVMVTLPKSGSPPRPVDDVFTVVDFYESKMSEYDSSFAFVPLSKLQDLRGMMDPQTGMTAVTSIQIKLKPDADLNAVRDRLRAAFPIETYRIQTWRDMQGPLLAAVQMETTILNILLFLIIAVAGFGILATFFMIVVEKTRDIGILKALGAPSGGVMSIFLGYGLSLGAVGSGAGLVLGLLFVRYINQIAGGLEWITGREIFDPTVYYFQTIPTIVNPFTVAWVVAGAVAIAVSASVLPARHAARLHPVEALRYE